MQDRHIDDLKRSMKRYRRIEEMVLSSHGRKGLEQLYMDDDQSDSSSTQNSAGSSGPDHLRDMQQVLQRLGLNSLGDFPEVCTEMYKLVNFIGRFNQGFNQGVN